MPLPLIDDVLEKFKSEHPEIAPYIFTYFRSSWPNCIIILCHMEDGRERRLLYNYKVNDYIYISHCQTF